MKVYRGYRIFESDHSGEGVVSQVCKVVVWENAGRYDLPMCLDIRNHSPTGFEWGYGGSGPAQLALALVADCMGRDLAVPTIYQHVKFKLVANFRVDTWTLTEEDLRVCIAAYCSDLDLEAGNGRLTP